MDLENVIYQKKDWDNIADIPCLHMSFLVHTLLPRRHFGLENVLTEKQKIIDGFLQMKSSLSKELEIVPVGSKAEGYGIPDAVKLENNPSIEYLSDIDAMLVRKGFQVTESEFRQHGTANSTVFETHNTHPGYGRVLYTAPKDIDHEFLFHEKQSGKYYLDSSKITKKAADLINEEPSDSLHYFRQGPALSVDDPTPMTHDRSKTNKSIHPQDYVSAIPCNLWPEIAKPWTKRPRNNNWLAQDVIESITSGGFHVVPVDHPKSKLSNIEWRLSFAQAEQQLAEQAVTASQKQCYIYLKILRKHAMKEGKILSSYCLKNVFLYCCEELPVSAWDDDPAGCILYMLDILIECVRRKNLPSFFIQENNLIDSLNEEEFHSIESILQELRADPISPVLNFTDKRVFCFPNECLSYSTTFRNIVQLVLDEIETIEQIDISRTVLGCFTDIQCNIASVMLGEKRSSFKYHLDFFQIFVDKYIRMPFVDFINYMGIRLDSPFITLMFYEKCLKEAPTFPELEYLRGNMACMCFALALTHDDDSKERKVRLHQAEKLFKEVLRNNGVHFASTIDFASFLSFNSRWEEVIALLEDFIEAEKKKPSLMQNGYYPAEATTLNEQIQREVKHTGCFLASSLSFAYYFMIKACVACKSGKISNILYNFAKHCKSVGNYGDYELLGYCSVDTKNYDLAEIAFSKAITLHQNNLLAQVNLNLCRVSRESTKKNRTTEKTILKFLLVIASALDCDARQVTKLLFLNQDL